MALNNDGASLDILFFIVYNQEKRYGAWLL